MTWPRQSTPERRVRKMAPARFGIGERFEDGQELVRVAPERGVEHSQQFCAEPTGDSDGRETEQRHQHLDPGNRGQAQ